MEDRRTMIRRGAVVIGSLLILLGLVIWGTLRLDTSSTNQSKIAKADKIHVAVVNDDSGSYYQRKVYQLGNDYLSQLQDTKNYDYAVVSRGVAENGLKKDQYQLVIYIPNNFSNAVMEINHPNPEKLDIQYKINASNEATKHQCEQIASSMIRDLNTRLTDIYTVGVMGNLYQAQNKVEDIYKRQGNLANRYQNDLSNPIASFSESFPDLNQQSNDLKRDNQEFQKMLSESLGDQYDDSLGQIQEMGTSVTDLIKEQSETNRNQAKIVSQLLKVNQGVCDDETSKFLDEMTQQNQTIQDGLSQQLETDCANLKEDFLDYSQQYEDKVSTLNDQMNQNKQTIEENTKALITDIHHQYRSDSLTLGDVLKKQDSELYQQLQDESEDVSSLQCLLDELPLKKIDPEHSPFSKETTEDIQKKIDSLNETLDELKKTGVIIIVFRKYRRNG